MAVRYPKAFLACLLALTIVMLGITVMGSAALDSVSHPSVQADRARSATAPADKFESSTVRNGSAAKRLVQPGASVSTFSRFTLATSSHEHHEYAEFLVNVTRVCSRYRAPPRLRFA